MSTENVAASAVVGQRARLLRTIARIKRSAA